MIREPREASNLVVQVGPRFSEHEIARLRWAAKECLGGQPLKQSMTQIVRLFALDRLGQLERAFENRKAAARPVKKRRPGSVRKGGRK